MSLHRHYIFNPVLSHCPPLCPTLTMEVQGWRRVLTMPNTAQEGSILTYAERQLHMDPSRPGSWGPSSLQAWTPPSSPLCTLEGSCRTSQASFSPNLKQAQRCLYLMCACES